MPHVRTAVCVADLARAPLSADAARARQMALRTFDFTPGEALTTLTQEARLSAASVFSTPAGPMHSCSALTRAAQMLYVRPTAGRYVVASARSSAAITVPDVDTEPQKCILHVIDGVLLPSSIDVAL